MNDVGTTKRKRQTPTQRLKMFEDAKGICYLCGLPIRSGEAWELPAFVDEHKRPLGLGGSNDRENRAPVHIRCAAVKTSDDMARINKAKAQKKSSLAIKPEGMNRLQGRGFQKFAKPPRAGKARIDKSALPPLPRRPI